jgi:uncharacterized protein YggT (Ycf19 family)
MMMIIHIRRTHHSLLPTIIIIIIIIIIIMKSSFDSRDNNYCHYVIQRIAGFAITLLYYHPSFGSQDIIAHY